MHSRSTNEQIAGAEFCRVFEQEMERLYALAVLLTANHSMAEECFVASLADCLNSPPVFEEWALTWSKRMVIKHAIRVGVLNTGDSSIVLADLKMESPLAQALFALDQFQRFVYVMSVLERYTDRDCALLLNCTAKQVAKARRRAFHQLAIFHQSRARSWHIPDSVRVGDYHRVETQ
jgi:DNA-directed RNA polymerase specialized sigma24 family protein